MNAGSDHSKVTCECGCIPPFLLGYHCGSSTSIFITSRSIEMLRKWFLNCGSSYFIRYWCHCGGILGFTLNPRSHLCKLRGRGVLGRMEMSSCSKLWEDKITYRKLTKLTRTFYWYRDCLKHRKITRWRFHTHAVIFAVRNQEVFVQPMFIEDLLVNLELNSRWL